MNAAGALLAWIVLPAVVIAGFVSVSGTARPATERVAGLIEWCGLLLASALLVAYVASDDAYLSDGTSRWDAHAAQGFTTFVVLVGLIAALLVGVAWALRLRRLGAVAYLAALAVAALMFAAVVANTAS